MTKLAFTTAPSQASHYLKALLAPKRGLRAGEALPPIEATLELAPSALALATYRRVCGFDATGVIKRTEFGVSKYAPYIGDDVTLTIHAAFEAAN